MIAIYTRYTHNLVTTVRNTMGLINFYDRAYNKYLAKCAKDNVNPLNKIDFTANYFTLSTIIDF